MNTRLNQKNIRLQLLATASAIALIAFACEAGEALAADSDASQPQIWIELGGQLSRLSDKQEPFAPDFMSGRPSIFLTPQASETPPRFSFDETGKLLFQPKDTDWVFSASIRYGHTRSKQDTHQQTNHGRGFSTRSGDVIGSITPYAHQFADTDKNIGEKHFIVDFQAGRDLGLGMLGSKDTSSVVSLGVRFAQFSTRSNVALKSDPDWHFSYKYIFGLHAPIYQPYHDNTASIRATRNFHGVGPSISWDGSASVAGNPQDSELTVDWGLNAALLFGRQRTKVYHQSTSYYHSKFDFHIKERTKLFQYTALPQNRSRSVTVPDVGGFAGLSYRYADAKLSFGYRADFFFGAIDGGIDTRNEENRGFFGPFANISVGLGD
jgi:iron complex outermembrane receptor protein